MENLKLKLQELFESSDWSVEDRNWLLNYLDKNDSPDLQKIMQQQFTENVNNSDNLHSDSAKKLLERIREKINSTGKPAKIIRMNFWKKAVAAAVIVMLGTGTFLLLNNKREKEIAKVNPYKPKPIDIAPGGNKAVLTLADGSQIILDSAANGNLASQGNTNVIKLDNGQLTYNGSGSPLGDGGEVLYNTISTPRGGQYQLVLADGTKVWLNAASSLRFPASFTGGERKVELKGEGYFEVAKNTSMPFKVNVAGKEEVEVLGTHFNINSYVDETIINTTLLEGKVKVISVINSELKTQNSQLLSPGQQAQLTATGQIFINKSPAIDEVMAWKNGKFQFGESADIATIMRQIARWYDVEVEYKGTVTEHIGGTISRDVKVSKVLEMLEMTGSVKFQMSGRKVIVMPK